MEEISSRRFSVLTQVNSTKLTIQVSKNTAALTAAVFFMEIVKLERIDPERRNYI